MRITTPDALAIDTAAMAAGQWAAAALVIVLCIALVVWITWLADEMHHNRIDRDRMNREREHRR